MITHKQLSQKSALTQSETQISDYHIFTPPTPSTFAHKLALYTYMREPVQKGLRKPSYFYIFNSFIN